MANFWSRQGRVCEYTIYVLFARGSKEARYVGHTSTAIGKRRVGHIKSAYTYRADGTASDFFIWVADLADKYEFEIEQLFMLHRATLAQAEFVERLAIEKLRQDGHRLFNVALPPAALPLDEQESLRKEYWDSIHFWTK